jgi:hypothetical protein
MTSRLFARWFLVQGPSQVEQRIMNWHKNVTKAVAALLVILACGAAAQAADPNGTWKWKVMFGNSGQEFELAVTLKADGEKLTGELELPMGDKIEIKDGAFKNDEVSFTTEIERNGVTRKTKYKGKVEGDTIKGKSERERDGEVMTRDWEPKREKK